MTEDPTRTGPPPDATVSAPPRDAESTAAADGPPPAIAPPDGVPGYEILAELGAGGMGVVWKARDIKLNRVVALKMVLGTRSGPKELIRFLAEAEAVAAVRHPNVVQVYEFGDHNGRPYLAMEYLPHPFRREAKPSAEAAKTMSKIARGVGAAHDLGIVHRDLKPGNVLLDESGEPKVTDFGLAKKGTQDLTNTHAVMGTPAYMSPEQAEAKSKFVTPAADVFSLGVMLYEQLTGTLPFAGDSALAVLKSIISDDPPPLKGLPRDISLICFKCLSKDPAERYPTATELASDLEKFAAGETVSVRAAGPVERAAKWVRRKPETAGLWAAAAVALMAGAIGIALALLYRDAGRQRDAAEALRGQEEAARKAAEAATFAMEAARDQLAKQTRTIEGVEYGRMMLLAQRAVQDNNIDVANELLQGTGRHLRGWEYGYVHRLCNDGLELKGHAGPLGAVAFSRDGGRIATASGDTTVRVWDAATGARVAELTGHRKTVLAVAFSPDGTRVATASADETARVWDVASEGTVAVLEGHRGSVRAVVYSADGMRVATGSSDRTGRVWIAATGHLVAELKGHTAEVLAVTYSPDGTRVATASGDRTARVWDAEFGTPVGELVGHAGPVTAAVFDRDGSRVATASEDNTARIWTVATGATVAELKGHRNAVVGVAFSTDGTRAATASYDFTARLWTAANGEPGAVLRGHTGPVTALAYRPGRDTGRYGQCRCDGPRLGRGLRGSRRRTQGPHERRHGGSRPPGRDPDRHGE